MAELLKIGILGTAKIAEPYIEEVKTSKTVAVTAVASRDTARADEFAKRFALDKAYGQYEDLLNDPEIDIIYNPLPNNLHVVWTEKALSAGKHVLCEKPFSDNPAAAARAFELADESRLTLLEAFPYRFQPFMPDIQNIVKDPDFGPVTQISASFGFQMRDETNIRLKADLHGGAIMDAGCYCLSVVRAIAGSAPSRVLALSDMHRSGVDHATMAILDYRSGLQAQISCSFGTAFHRSAHVVGEHGVLEFAFPNSALPGESPTYRLRKGDKRSYEFDQLPLDAGRGFQLESEAIADMITGERDDYETFRRETIDNADTLAAVKQSAKMGGWVAVAEA